MSDDISIKLGLEGEKEWKKALEETHNTLRQLDSGLKANAAEFAAHDGAIKGDAKSTELMRKTLETQKKYVEQLGKAVEWSTDKYGAASKKTTSYVVAQNRAREAVAKMEKQLTDTDREMEELGRDAGKVGSQIEAGLSDAVKGASGELDGLIDKISNTLGISPGMTLGAGIMAAGAATAGIVSSVVGSIDGIVTETADHRRSMNFTQTNAEMGSYDWEFIRAKMFEVVAVLGDLDGATEGMNSLMAAELSANNIIKAADAMMGAAIKWPETMQFENLAESFQESIGAGKATGAFAELLDRTGLSAEAFDEVMKVAVDAEERQRVAMQYLEAAGTAATKEKYTEDHAEEIENNQSKLEYEDAMSHLGQTLLPVSTAATDLKTELVKTADNLAGTIIGAITEGSRKAEEEKAEKEKTKQEINERTGQYDRIEELNRQITEADEAGDYVAASQLQAERDQAVKEIAETVKAMNEGGKEAGGELTEGVKSGIEEGTAEMESASKTAMKSVFSTMETSVAEDGNAVLAKTSQFVSAYNATISQMMAPYLMGGGVGYMPSPVGAAGQNPAGNINVTMTLDGRKVGSAIAPYVSGSIGRSSGQMMDR